MRILRMQDGLDRRRTIGIITYQRDSKVKDLVKSLEAQRAVDEFDGPRASTGGASAERFAYFCFRQKAININEL